MQVLVLPVVSCPPVLVVLAVHHVVAVAAVVVVVVGDMFDRVGMARTAAEPQPKSSSQTCRPLLKYRPDTAGRIPVDLQENFRRHFG